MEDLYKLDLTKTEWTSLCGGQTGDAGDDEEACVEFTPIPGANAFALRDSKNPDAGTLRFFATELANFKTMFDPGVQ